MTSNATTKTSHNITVYKSTMTTSCSRKDTKRDSHSHRNSSKRFIILSLSILLGASVSISTANAFTLDRIKSFTNSYGVHNNYRYSSTTFNEHLFSSSNTYTSTALQMSKSGGDNNGRKGRRQNGTGSDNGKFGKHPQSQSNQRKSARNKRSNTKGTSAGFSKTAQTSSSSSNSRKDAEYQERITQLEALAASQAVELRKLRVECDKLKEAAETFNEVVNLLRKAGLQTDETKSASTSEDKNGADDDAGAKSKDKNGAQENSIQSVNSQKGKNPKAIMAYEAFDDSEIFGTAPRSVTDAADAAGTSVLAALLGGKQRMLVDVRDAELSRDLDILAQFIELSILPVAAGLEGLKTKKNRVKIVFPTVSLLMQYRKSMTLAAPEVISLSTLGLDPVEDRDNLVVIIAPSPDDPEGLAQMDELLESPSLRQPVVVLNHHMVPLLGPGGEFEPVYHLRLLSVQYMTGESPPPEWDRRARRKEVNGDNMPVDTATDTDDSNDNGNQMANVDDSNGDYDNTNANNKKDIVSGGDGESQHDDDEKEGIQEDAELEAAMEHAHELGVHQGVTRAMVIRAYPRPWHIFVDTSPDSDADFEVAATFDECPTPDDVNYAIVECLEGSEREDELVAQQMQEALESGQLNTVKDMLGLPIIETDMDVAADASDESDDEDDEDDNDEDDWHTWGTDTV